MAPLVVTAHKRKLIIIIFVRMYISLSKSLLALGTNREGHGGLAGRRIVGGMRTKAQGPQARKSVAGTSSWCSLSGNEEGEAG